MTARSRAGGGPTRPLRLVFATVGSRGDVQPMLALALHAQARGHSVVLAAPPDFERWVRAHGMAFQPLGRDMQQFLDQNAAAMTSNPLRLGRMVERYFAEDIPRQPAQLLQACEGVDAIAWAGLAFAAPTVAEHLRVPALGILFTTCVLPSRGHPPPTFPWYGAPGWANGMLWKLSDWLNERTVGQPLNAVRAGFGLPARPLRPHMMEASRYVMAADAQVFPEVPEWAGRYDRSTFIAYDDPRELPPDLVAWLDGGEPPVFAGFGSMTGPGPERARRAFVDAVAASGRRGLLGAGWARLGAGALPPGWRVVDDVPHARLFPRLAAVVHHGGSGTTATALRAGVPQVVLPLFLDQFHHAHGLHRAGLAPRPVPMERITARRLAAMLDEAMALPAGPRQEAAQRLASRDARVEIVDRLEALAE